MFVKSVAIAIGTAICAVLPGIMERSITQRQMANSSIPLLVTIIVPFVVSLVVTTVRPDKTWVTVTWIVMGTVAYFWGDVYAIFHGDVEKHTLWPIELVMLTGLVIGALVGGALLAHNRLKTNRRGKARDASQ